MLLQKQANLRASLEEILALPAMKIQVSKIEKKFYQEYQNLERHNKILNTKHKSCGNNYSEEQKSPLMVKKSESKFTEPELNAEDIDLAFGRGKKVL